jgi:hypothetical protein
VRDPQVIPEYVEALADKLSFDPSLSQRVRREIEDHLWEAVAQSATGNACAAASQAIAQLGDAHALAAEFAAVRLAGETQKVSATAILLVGAALLVMKARVAWYGIAQWQLDDQARALAATVGVVDACSFWLAAALTVSGWLYVIGKPAAASSAALCRQLRHVICLNSAAVTALAISVTCDAALTALRLLGRGLSVQSLIPLSSMAAESVLVGLLIFKIGGLMARMSRTTRLLDA